MISSRNYIITLCICWVMCGCSQPKMLTQPEIPTQEEIRSANYGTADGGILKSVAETAFIMSMKRRLKDPYSAKFKFSDQLYKGFIVGKTKTEYGWFLDTYVNAKNSYGAYTGYKQHRALFRNGEMVGGCERGICVLLTE